MITRFYVDNYKCLVNFEYKPKALELIVGANGSGKTTVFEALENVRKFIINESRVEDLFPPSSLTRWQSREFMSIELELDVEGNHYEYSLSIGKEYSWNSIRSESLKINGDLVRSAELKYELEDKLDKESGVSEFLEIKSHSAGNIREYRVAETTKSSLTHLGSVAFTNALRNIIFVQIQPARMSSLMKTSQRRLSKSLANFPAYYLHLLQEKQGLIFDLLPLLRENIEGFRSFVLEERGAETRELRVEFAVEGGKKGQTVRYDFSELSDGQRALIALYTIAFCESNSTLLIDEPENYISLRELQPWLKLLQERIEDFGGQAILISHHPEFINELAPQDAIQFRRNNGGPVMIRPFDVGPYQGLTPAEIVARGWENE